MVKGTVHLERRRGEELASSSAPDQPELEGKWVEAIAAVNTAADALTSRLGRIKELEASLRESEVMRAETMEALKQR